MCTRYYIDAPDMNAYRDYMHDLKKIARREGDKYVIYPSLEAPVYSYVNRDSQVRSMNFGYLGKDKSGLILNARSESILEKPMFESGVRYHRVLVPASGFYEWNALKEKRTFTRSDKRQMYFAGISDIQEQRERFCIITTEANVSMKDTHDRMPLILDPEMAQDWLKSESAYKELLEITPPLLDYTSEYEQMTLQMEMDD